MQICIQELRNRTDSLEKENRRLLQLQTRRAVSEVDIQIGALERPTTWLLDKLQKSRSPTTPPPAYTKAESTTSMPTFAEPRVAAATPSARATTIVQTQGPTAPPPPANAKVENTTSMPTFDELRVAAATPTTHATTSVQVQEPTAPSLAPARAAETTTPAQVSLPTRRGRKRHRTKKRWTPRHHPATQLTSDNMVAAGEPTAQSRRKRARKDRARRAGLQAGDPNTGFQTENVPPWWNHLPENARERPRFYSQHSMFHSRTTIISDYFESV